MELSPLVHLRHPLGWLFGKNRISRWLCTWPGAQVLYVHALFVTKVGGDRNDNGPLDFSFEMVLELDASAAAVI